MARQPPWTEEEWTLLLDVFHRTAEHPTDEDVERLRQDLFDLAMRSEDLRIREAVNDPHFRTRRSISGQSAFLRTLTREGRRVRPTQNLEGVWELFQVDPDAVTAAAAEVRRHARAVGDPGAPTDTDRIRRFVDDAHDLIAEVVRILPQLPARRIGDVELRDYLAAWEDLRERPFRSWIRLELARVENARLLSDAGLTGPQLTFKLGQFGRALRNWKRTRKVESLMEAFRYADIVLGSLSQALPGPGVDMFKEFKEGTEAVLDRALPPRGYVPALSPA